MIGAPAVDANEFSTPGQRIGALDGVRGLAILIVVIHNAGFILKTSTAFLPKLLGAITVTGWIGVQLFFVLSGFLITGLLVDSRDQPDALRTFYVRRTLRIFPLCYAFLIGAFILVPVIVDAPAWEQTAREHQWWYWTYLANWSQPLGMEVPGLTHFWSLAVEEQFYVFWPLVALTVPTRVLRWLCLAVIASSPIIRWAMLDAGLPKSAVYQFTIARWDALALGAVVALIVRDPILRRWFDRRLLACTAAVVVALMALVLRERGFHENDVNVLLFGQTLIALGFGALILAATAGTAQPAQWLQRALTARALRLFGKYSYAIYIFHYPVHRLASGPLADLVNGPDSPGRVLRVALYAAALFGVSLLLAMLSWRVLEEPFLRLKDRLAPRALHSAVP